MTLRSKLGLALTALACGSSSVAPIEILQLPNLMAVSGDQDIVVTASIPYSSNGQLDVYRQDPSQPDRLLHVASVPLAVGFNTGLSVTPDWIFAQGLLVSLSAAPTVTPISIPAPLGEHAAAHGQYLLTSGGPSLALYSIADAKHPALLSSFTAAGPVKLTASLRDGFLAFRDGGYVALSNLAQPTWVDRSDPNAAFPRTVTVSGTQVAIGGPSVIAGLSAFVRYDASNPANLSAALVANNLAGEYSDSAWDGAGAYAVISQNGVTSPSVVHVYREQTGTLIEVRSFATTFGHVSANTGPSSYAWNGRIYGSSGQGLTVYRLQ
jgi:hypothetical protein